MWQKLLLTHPRATSPFPTFHRRFDLFGEFVLFRKIGPESHDITHHTGLVVDDLDNAQQVIGLDVGDGGDLVTNRINRADVVDKFPLKIIAFRQGTEMGF